jgi:hypothetical protein
VCSFSLKLSTTTCSGAGARSEYDPTKSKPSFAKAGRASREASRAASHSQPWRSTTWNGSTSHFTSWIAGDVPRPSPSKCQP